VQKGEEESFSFNMDEFQVAMNKLGAINLEASEQIKSEDRAFLQKLFSFLDRGNNGSVQFALFSYFSCQIFNEQSEVTRFSWLET
jgi:hypothetical protein